MLVAPSETFSQIGGTSSTPHVSLRKLSPDDKSRHLENTFNALESALSQSKECVTLGEGSQILKESEIQQKQIVAAVVAQQNMIQIEKE